MRFTPAARHFLICALLLGPIATTAQAQDPLVPSWYLLVDQEYGLFVDPGTGDEIKWAGVFQADPDVDAVQDPADGALLFEGRTQLPRAWNMIPLSLSELLIVDANADPAGLGPDPNPENSDPNLPDTGGFGALWTVDAGTGQFTLLSDGTDMAGGLPPGVPSAFMTPRDLWLLSDNTVLVVDPDSNASGFGFDPGREDLDPSLIPHAGFGALLKVDMATGEVTLLADGSNYSGAMPDVDGDTIAEPSVFIDPWAITQDPGDPDHVLVLDASADPLATGAELGAVFRVNLTTGRVDYVASDVDWIVPLDITWKESLGTFLVLDAFGTLPPDPVAPTVFRWDGPDSSIWSQSPDLVFPIAMTTDSGDDLLVLDSDADPLGYGFPIGPGALFRLPDSAPDNADVLFSSADTFLLGSVVEVPVDFPPLLDPLTVAEFCSGISTTLNLTGSGFLPDAVVSVTGGISVDSQTWINSNNMTADITIPCGQLPGPQTVQVLNPASGLFATTTLTVDPSLGDPGPPTNGAGDINGDKYVDGLDLADIAQAFGSSACCDPNFLNDADLDDNGVVDGVDLGIFATSFGLRFD